MTFVEVKLLASKMKVGVVTHMSLKAVPEASQPCPTQDSPCPSEPQH